MATQETQKNIKVGDTVMIKDERDQEITGMIMCENVWEMQGHFGIDVGSYGWYARTAEEIVRKV